MFKIDLDKIVDRMIDRMIEVKEKLHRKGLLAKSDFVERFEEREHERSAQHQRKTSFIFLLFAGEACLAQM